jgi:large subunit ribosomal protein L25
MATEIRIKAERRTEHGSAPARRLRRAGYVPAAINRRDGASQTLQINAHELEKVLRHQASNQVLVTLELDGQPLPTLLREIQTDVMDGHVIHADFGEISLTEKLRVSIALRVTGEPEGVRTEGGILEQTLRQVEVECLPSDIVASFTVDVSHLKLGQSLAVRDLQLGAPYTLVTGGDVAVATIVAAAEEEEVAPEAAAVEGAAAAEPEVIAKGKKEEGEEGAEGEAAPAAGAGAKKEGAKGAAAAKPGAKEAAKPAAAAKPEEKGAKKK